MRELGTADGWAEKRGNGTGLCTVVRRVKGIPQQSPAAFHGVKSGSRCRRAPPRRRRERDCADRGRAQGWMPTGGGIRKTCGAFALWETVLGAFRPPRAVFHGAKAPPPFPRRTRLTGALGNGRRETVAIRGSASRKGSLTNRRARRLARRKGSKTPRSGTVHPSRCRGADRPTRGTRRGRSSIPKTGRVPNAARALPPLWETVSRAPPYAPCGFPWRRLRAPLPEARPGSGRHREGREAKGSKALHGNRSPMGNQDRVGGVF